MVGVFYSRSHEFASISGEHCSPAIPEPVWLYDVSTGFTILFCILSSVAFFYVAFFYVEQHRQHSSYSRFLPWFGVFLLLCGFMQGVESWTLWQSVDGIFRGLESGAIALFIALLATFIPMGSEVLAIARGRDDNTLPPGSPTAAVSEALFCNFCPNHFALTEARQRYQDLVEHSPDIIERFDLQLRHLYVSPVLTKITGITTDVFLGKTCRELGMDEAMVNTWEAAATKLLATGEKQVIEFATPTLKGERTFEMAIAPEWADDHTIKSILCLSRDITDRKLTEAALKTQRDFNHLIAQITSRFVNLSSEHLNLEINQTLRQLGELTQADSSYLLRFDEHTSTLSMTHEWFAPQHSPQLALVQNIPFTDFPWAIAKFQQQEIVYIPHLADLPPAATVDQTNWQRFNLVSLLAVPLIVRTRVVGLIGFASYSQPMIWHEDAIQLLNVLGQTIVNAQQQVEDEQQLAISEERLRLALMAANQGFYDLHIPTGKAIVSPEYALMLGYDPATFEETNGQWIERLHPDDRPSVATTYHAYIAGTLPEYKVEFRQRTQTGGYVWILSMGKIVEWDADGHPLRMLGTHTDISDRKKAEEARLQAEKLCMELTLLERIFDNVLAGYWDWDIRNHTTYMSPGFKRMFGYEDYELPNVPETWQNLMFAEDLPGVWQQFDRHVQSRGEVMYYNEVRYRHRNGSTVWVICAGQVIEWDEAGQPLRLVGCHVDITPLKQTELQLKHRDAHLREAQRISKLGSWEYDLLTEHITWSEQVFQMFGRNPAEGTPKSFNELQQYLHLDDRALHQQVVQTALETRQPYDIEYRIYRADGSMGWMQARGEARVDATGRVAQLTGTVLDITEQKQVADQLRTLSDRLALALQSGAIGTWDWDTVHDAIWDARMHEIYGLQHLDHAVTYQDWAERVHTDDLDRVEAALQAAIRGEQEFNIEFRAWRTDGQLCWIRAIALTQRNTTGKLVRMIGINYDITEAKQAEAKILQTTAQLEASNRELEAFAYSVSHDLRAPLRSISGFSKALLEDYGDRFDAQGQDYFDRIQRNVQRMGLLIDDLLRLSRISRTEMQYIAVNLSELVQEHSRELQASEPERRVEWVVAPGAIVLADPTLMQVVLHNLLENAWKFTAHHSSARIEFGIIKQHEQPVYFVRDDGAGFDMVYASKLFGVFQRLHNTDEFPGTGIGLATVQRAVHRHGGRVWAEARVEKGATIYFTVPGSPVGKEYPV